MEDTRCELEETPCAKEANYTCFKCKNCDKVYHIAKKLADNISSVRALTKCGNYTLPPQPSAGSAAPASGTPDASTTAVKMTAGPARPPYVWDPAGPGTQLKKFLAKVGIKSTENCSCNARAKLMNERGIEWCEQNVNEIVGWLKEEAGKRKLPFLSMPAKIVVQRAIKIAKKIRDEHAAASSESAEGTQAAAE